MEVKTSDQCNCEVLQCHDDQQQQQKDSALIKINRRNKTKMDIGSHTNYEKGLSIIITFINSQPTVFILVSCLIFCTFPNGTNANTTSVTGGETTVTTTLPVQNSNTTGKVTVTDVDDLVPKAVITVAAFIVFFAIAFGVAKLMDYCHDRRAISDDASDISDYTKELLKAQMMMLIFNRGRQKGKKLKPEEAAKKYAKVWRAKLARNKARNMKAQKEARIAAEKAGKDPSLAAAEAAIQADKKRQANQLNTKTTASSNPPTNLTTVNELKEVNPGTSAKSGPIVSPRPPTSQDGRKGSSRPISAGLKSRPASAKSTKSSKFKSFGKFMVKR